jgi:hypothetical protein
MTVRELTALAVNEMRMNFEYLWDARNSITRRSRSSLGYLLSEKYGVSVDLAEVAVGCALMEYEILKYDEPHHCGVCNQWFWTNAAFKFHGCLRG